MKPSAEFFKSLMSLRQYCEDEHFKGWDPYDGLNSKVAQCLLPLKHSAFLRLCVIQGFKRCPVNLRRLALVPKEFNAKGVALLLQAYCNFYLTVQADEILHSELGTLDELKSAVDSLAQLLISLRSNGDYHGSCWGYNFDWQARLLFLFPKYTPTVVATSFATSALCAAYEITRNSSYLEAALSSAEFVMCDLHRTACRDGFMFSYSPLKGQETVYNASLLGSRIMAQAYHYTHKQEYLEAARNSVLACCAGQQADGSWVYGQLPVQNWIDSFHTGYNLVALSDYQRLTGDFTFEQNLRQGLEFYLHEFWEADGCPKYYSSKKYPIDIHCPAQLPVTLSATGAFAGNSQLANSVMHWAIRHMQHRKGYFYYQLKPHFSSKISYMRWSNAFMLYGMSYYLKETVKWTK